MLTLKLRQTFDLLFNKYPDIRYKFKSDGVVALNQKTGHARVMPIPEYMQKGIKSAISRIKKEIKELNEL